MKHAGKIIGKRALKLITEEAAHYYWNKTQKQIKDQENMKKTNKTKKQVIVVPTTQKSLVKVKPTKTLTKSRPIRSKTDTLAYYHRLIDQITNPTNQKTKITNFAHHCQC